MPQTLFGLVGSEMFELPGTGTESPSARRRLKMAAANNVRRHGSSSTRAATRVP